MKKLFLVMSILCTFTLCIGQTKQQTLDYINGVFRDYNNGRDFGRILEKSPSILLYSFNLFNYSITNEFSPKKVINFLVTEDYRGHQFTITFKANSVKRKSGETSDEDDAVRLNPIPNLTVTELSKFTKALKYLFKLYGGQLNESEF